jgi:hypothetical protein
MKGQPVIGYTVGNGAAINVELGFIPDLVQVWNLTDADEVHTAFLGGDRYVVPFSSGGTTEVAAGATIKGATSNATATVVQVLLYSGTWAGGDAAGFFVVRDVVGTFGSENVYVSSDTTSGTNDATVTANVNHTVAIIDSGSGTTVLSLTTGNDALSKYVGSVGSAAKGFTIGSGIAEEAKLLGYAAWRSDV